jgi:hypothetical protein
MSCGAVSTKQPFGAPADTLGGVPAAHHHAAQQLECRHTRLKIMFRSCGSQRCSVTRQGWDMSCHAGSVMSSRRTGPDTTFDLAFNANRSLLCCHQRLISLLQTSCTDYSQEVAPPAVHCGTYTKQSDCY